MTVVAGRTLSSYCDRFCIGDFRKKATLELRTVQPPKIGDTKATELFTVAFTGFFRVETSNGTGRFSGVNIEKEATHLFLTPFKTSLSNLDAQGEYFIRSSNKLYRTIRTTNINEYDTYILFQVTERGLDTKEESNA